jgi:phospholipase C
VVIVQENHTFDTYFGRYCTAATGSSPTCTNGSACCEAGPPTDPTGASPIVLDDTANGAYDPDHTQACELQEADGGAMDRYVTGANGCSDPRNFAYADPTTVRPYWDLASAGALADRYFQPVSGQSSSNDMYLARSQFVFLDNAYEPNAIGAQCSISGTMMSFPGPTIGDLLDTAGVSWAFYAEGYQAMVAARQQDKCPKPPADCAFGLPIYPCDFDPTDDPFDYYSNLADDPKVLRDYAQLATDLKHDTLPQVVFVKGLGYHTEHPGELTTISAGAAFVGDVIAAIDASDYAPDTLILVAWDEGGGFFDHIAPPGSGAVDGEPYGTRVPLLAIGPFAAAGTVSHVQMEHSSIVKFVEWNWLDMQTGQLAGRDADVANLGSLLDASATGAMVP